MLAYTRDRPFRIKYADIFKTGLSREPLRCSPGVATRLPET